MKAGSDTPGLRPFHLALPVDDLAAARHFYADILGCAEGRSADSWIDFNFFGHQFVVHLGTPLSKPDQSDVDGHAVPQFHFGIVLDMADWRVVKGRLKAADVLFIMEPTIRFEGLPGEQATLFVKDPAGNALEFKALTDLSLLFEKNE